MTTRTGRHQHRAVPAERRHSNSDPWNQYPSWSQGVAINVQQSYNDPITGRNSVGIRAGSQDLVHIEWDDPYRLPPPPEGSKPPHGWEELERNAYWPFPADMPRELQIIRTPAGVLREREAAAANVTQNEDSQRNSFWPFPNPFGRRDSTRSTQAPRPASRSNTRQRTESNPAPPAPQPRSILKRRSGEGTTPYVAPAAAPMARTRSRDAAAVNDAYEPAQRPRSILRSRSGERNPSNNVPPAPRPRTPFPSASGDRADLNSSSQPAPRPRTLSGSQRRERRASSNSQNVQPAAPTAPTVTEDPFSYHNRVAPIMNSYMTMISPLLAQDSVGLIHFDLRLPHTSAKKLVHNHHWTHLNHDDIKQPACTPPRTRMRIYTHITGSEWSADVRPRSRDYVTVEDVLMGIFETLSVPVDAVRWARDGINPTLKDRVYRAYNRRIERVRSVRADEYSRAKKKGFLRVDYLGSKYLFGGLTRCYGGDESEWFQMQVVAG